MNKSKNEIFLEYLFGKTSLETTMENLSKINISASMVHTEANLWIAIKNGVQTIDDKKQDVDLAFYLYGSQRFARKTVRQAMLEFLWPNNILDTDEVLVKPDRTVLIKKIPNSF